MKGLTLSKRQENITLAAVFTVGGVVYCLISLVNHYLFKTYALDLGLYTHAMYDYAHFRIDDCSMFKDAPQSILAAHFDLYLVLLSPLVYVFGSYTLLIVQIAAVLFGGWGIFKLIGLYTDDHLMPLLAVTVFFFSFGILHALSYDYHSNVLTAMMLPWLLYFIKQGRFGWASLMVVLFVIGKENLSLWLFFIAVGLMWDYRKDRKTLLYLLGYAVFALAYFLVVNMLILPKIGGAGISRYDYLGSNYMEIGHRLLTHPAETLRILFTNTSGNPALDGRKAEFYWCAMATGMALTLLKPNYLFMLIPLVAQKMFAIDAMFWGVSVHYNVEVMPVIVIASFLVIVKLKKQRPRLVLACALLLSTIWTTFYTLDKPKSFILADQVCIYKSQHYKQSNFDVDYARQLIKQIPDDASVCAGTMFVPHLALRPEIYDFYSVAPTVRADYMLVTTHYLELERGGKLWMNYRDEYETVATDGTLYLLRRIQP